jgi:hypothetical protein
MHTFSNHILVLALFICGCASSQSNESRNTNVQLNQSQQSSLPVLERPSDWENRSLDIEKAKAIFSNPDHKLDWIEGIWVEDEIGTKGYTLAITKESKQGSLREYVAVVIDMPEELSTLWQIGDAKIDLTYTADRRGFRCSYAMGDFSIYNSEAVKARLYHDRYTGYATIANDNTLGIKIPQLHKDGNYYMTGCINFVKIYPK